ncbi:MAG: TolC family protein [bacterium]
MRYTRVAIIAILLLVFSSVYGQTTLTLNDCINLALKNNLDIKVQGFNPKIAQKTINIERASFDKNLVLKSNLAGADSPTTEDLSIGISQKLYWGTNYNIELKSQRQKESSPSYQSDLSLSLT